MFQNSGTKRDPSNIKTNCWANWEPICRQEAWTQAGGPCTGFLNFSQFAHFAEAQGTIGLLGARSQWGWSLPDFEIQVNLLVETFWIFNHRKKCDEKMQTSIFFRVFLTDFHNCYHLIYLLWEGCWVTRFSKKSSNFRIQKRRWASPCRWVWNSLEHQGLVGAVGGLPKPCESHFFLKSQYMIQPTVLYVLF